MAERPLGVTVIAFLSLIAGVFSLLKGLLWLGLGGAAAGVTALANPAVGVMVGGIALLFGGIAVLSGLFSLFTAWGSFNLKGWAWTLGVANNGFILAWSVLAALGPSTFRERTAPIVVSGAILFYLTRPAVKTAFGKA